MTGATLLVELLTEELPPKALPKLGQAFSNGIVAGLRARAWRGRRRLPLVRHPAPPGRDPLQRAPEAAAKDVTEKIMPVSVALTADGQPTPALTKKLEAKGIPLSAVAGFERRMDGKAEALFHTSTVAGAKLAEVLAGIVQDALKALPIPKVMRWGDGDATFVRPAHKLTMLHGASVVPGSVLDIQSGRTTRATAS
jgi:glycyl-tRNA synthetase beta chain